MHAAIDFGISNTDALAHRDGVWHRWTAPSAPPDQASVERILAAGGLSLRELTHLHVTGGQHKALLPRLGDCTVIPIAEVTAIGRGGLALARETVSSPGLAEAMIVSAGSGAAMIAARGDEYTHITGTGVGGGTLLGLARLLLGTTDPATIDAMALRGDPNGADLALRDVVTGPIGTLPPDATAVNFGRIAKQSAAAAPNDLAAALVTLVGQVIAVTAVNAARAERLARIVMIGHLTDMQSFRAAVGLVSQYYATPILLPDNAGYGTVLGAFLHPSSAAA